MKESAGEADNDDDLSSLGDASPMDDGEALQAQRLQKCRSKLQKYCSISFVAIYALVYFSLSSNPEVVLVNSGYQYDQRVAAVGASQSRTHSNLGNHTPMNSRVEFPDARMRDRHIEQTASLIARVFTPVSPSEWCIDGRLKFEQAKGRPMGLCYVKIPRGASTTLAGINERIARNFAARQGLEQTCIRHQGPTSGFYYRQREKSLSYLWTFVRDPTDRAMSRVASNVAKRKIALPPADLQKNKTDSTSDYVLNALKTSTDVQFGTISEGRGGFQVQYTMQTILDDTFWNAAEPTKVQHEKRMQLAVKAILERYDFIGTVERFDESLVALQLLLGLETSDVLHFSSRLHSQYTGTSIQGGKALSCQKNVDPKELRTPVVEEHLTSPEWWAKNYGDFLLHRAASLSLDQTISKIGPDVFSDALTAFRLLLQKARETCHPIFPCSDEGKDQSGQAEDDCYLGDMGCGSYCIDRMLTKDETEKKD